MEEKPLYIDVKKVVEGKNQRLSKRIPNFVYRFLARLIHQDELNAIFEHAHGKTGVDFVHLTLDELGIKYQAVGFENIPDNGRFIFASNHPLGGLDALVMMDCVAQKYPDIKFVANDLLMHLKPMHSIFLPVNKHGKQNLDYAKIIRESYDSNAQMLYFPAGLCSRKNGKVIRDLEWKTSFVKSAIASQRDIIPVFFEGKNSAKFYRIANIRKQLGIRFNFEMILLPDEMFRQKGCDLKIHFGNPISYQTFNKSKSLRYWTEYVREQVYGLAQSKI